MQTWLDKGQDLGITPSTTETPRHPTVRNATAAVPEVSGGEILVGTSPFGARILPMRL